MAEGSLSSNTEERNILSSFVRVIAIAYSMFHLYTAGAGAFQSLIQRSCHVGFALVLTFLMFKSTGTRKSEYLKWYDYLFVGGSIAGTVLISVRSDFILMNPAASDLLDLILGGVTLLLVLEAARRVVGVPFVIIAILMVIYAFAGPILPGIFRHRGIDYTAFIEMLYLSTDGFWGTVTGVTATVVAMFIIFGGVLLKSGGSKTFTDIGFYLTGRQVGGPAKIAVISSGLFGTLSGSGAANVAVTGNFTIPMMKRYGFKNTFAAAVEAVASTGGQLVPPVMGAGAFIMSEIIATPYSKICLAAIIPAFLYYLGSYMSVHFYTLNKNIIGNIDDDYLKEMKLKLLPIVELIIPIVVLIWFIVEGYTPGTAAFWATSTLIVYHIFRKPKWREIYTKILTLLDAFYNAGIALIMIGVIAACAQIVISVLNMTGLGVKFSNFLASLAQGNLFLGLIMAMVITIILGMGIPTVAAYVVAAAVAAPSLVVVGVPPLAAHMFVFYFAVLGSITPPVCTSVYVAAGIAKCPWLPAAFSSVRNALSGFIVPFMFVYFPALLLVGGTFEIIQALVTSSIGVTGLSAGVQGYFRRTNSIVEGILLIIFSIMLIIPETITDILGMVGIIILWGIQYKKGKGGKIYVEGEITK